MLKLGTAIVSLVCVLLAASPARALESEPAAQKPRLGDFSAPTAQSQEETAATADIPSEKPRLSLGRGLRLGQWVSADPLYVEASESAGARPRSLNLYSYVGGNPYRFVDPLGLDDWEAGDYFAVWFYPTGATDAMYNQARNEPLHQIGVVAAGTAMAATAAAGGLILYQALIGPQPEEPGNLGKPETPRRHSRKTEYPSRNRKGVKKRVVDKHTDDKGRVIDPKTGKVIPKEKVTIEHKKKVVDHWNEGGRNQTREARNDWYNDDDNLEVMHEDDARKQGGATKETYSQETGPNYTRLTEKRRTGGAK